MSAQPGPANPPAGDAPEPSELVSELEAFTHARGAGRPAFPGGVVLLIHDGAVVLHAAFGMAVRYADGAGTELPPDEQVAMSPDTIFDVASVTKLFTSILALRQVEAGRLDLDAPVADYLPAFAAGGASGGRAAITARHLLTHTSGLRSWVPLWSGWPDDAARVNAVLTAVPDVPPGQAYVYSDLNMITLGVLVAELAGRPLDDLVRTDIADPLGMADTGFRPPESKRDRIAATEYQTAPDRGMVRGVVHDENALAFSGVAGHAGVFSTAADLAALAQDLLGTGGTGGDGQVLGASSVAAMMTDENASFPGNAHGLGFELDQPWYMGALSAPWVAGHTGFTGTSLVLDPRTRSAAILLTNRVHPSRDWASVNPARRLVASSLAQLIGDARAAAGARVRTTVPAANTGTAAEPGVLHAGEATLRRAPARLSFDLLAPPEVADELVLEVAASDGPWTPAALSWRARGEVGPYDRLPDGQPRTGGAGRYWWQVFTELARTGEVRLRWRVPGSGSVATVRGVRLADECGPVAVVDSAPSRVRADGPSRTGE